MIRKGIVILLIICMSSIVMSCDNDKIIENTSSADYEIPEKLNIYIVSDAVHEYYQSEDRENVYYTTMMSVGDFDITTTTYGEKGFMYYDAFSSFQKETGIDLEIKWYERAFQMEEDLENLDESEWPDLVITTNSTTADYYRYMDEGYFYDLTDFATEREMYTSGAYYNQILRAGEYNQKQYILPILFNIDTIMGSKEMWEKISLHIEDVNTHSELLDALVYAQNQKAVEQVAVHFGSDAAIYLPHALYSSSGEKWIDYDEWNANLDKTIFQKMGVFYEQFLDEQFGKEWIQGEKIPWFEAKHNTICMAIENDVQLDEFLDDIGCFVEGGASFQTFLHSAAAQAWYYESRYRDLKQEFEIFAMPGIDGGTTAHVSYMGAVLQNSEYPEAAFEFLKYIMDSDVSAFFGFSVNCESTQKQLEYLTDTSYYLRPGLQIRLDEGTLADSMMDYLIQPMTEETKGKLEEMLGSIENASLPNWPVYEIIDLQLQRYAKGECDIEDAYDTTINNLNSYAEGR